MKNKATSSFVPCEFPFKFEGETHYGCIDFIEINNGRKVPGDPWCSTKVIGSDRTHVGGGGHYGECHSRCPGANNGKRPGKGTRRTTTRRPTIHTGEAIGKKYF